MNRDGMRVKLTVSRCTGSTLGPPVKGRRWKYSSSLFSPGSSRTLMVPTSDSILSNLMSFWASTRWPVTTAWGRRIRTQAALLLSSSALSSSGSKLTLSSAAIFSQHALTTSWHVSESSSRGQRLPSMHTCPLRATWRPLGSGIVLSVREDLLLFAAMFGALFDRCVAMEGADMPSPFVLFWEKIGGQRG